MKKSVLILFLCFLLFLITIPPGCKEGVQLAKKIMDSDSDNWYDSATNQRVDLFITSIVTIGGGGLIQPGPPNVIVDDIIFNGVSFSPGFNATTPVATRFVGTWLLEGGDGPKNFVSKVKIFSGLVGSSNDLSATNVSWHNRDSTWTQTIPGAGLITFRSVITRFADPNPHNSAADTDGDGITELEESLIAGDRTHLGDVSRRDILLVCTHTHSDMSLRPFAKEQLTTIFSVNGANLQIIDDGTTLTGINGGQLPGRNINDVFVIIPNNTNTTASSLRPGIVAARFDPFVHVAILQSGMATTDQAGNGRSSGIPGLGLVMKSSLPILGRDIWDYQAKLLMHEFGHNLGLCHPTTGGAPCVALPAAEANNGTTVMGTPADDPNIFMTVGNTLNRPLNYSPTQWANLLLVAARNSTR